MYPRLSPFLFQAEDGIRDFLCGLPYILAKNKGKPATKVWIAAVQGSKAMHSPHSCSAGSRGLGRTSSSSPSCEKIIDRKSTRLNSSHLVISYAVFCLKKKK